ncbi:hypothetical protein [Methermicoccus shengliensis]|uniref:Single-stranded DNA-binding protein n=1 Tax=Methermicoccus shengliensis TaxID=660064 RepID=A0A832RWM3_9EURY|nr:hypothetical protein [Methermicoccus shengliensis]KUK05212.1 MAG: hypothetical protein XD46_0205 [Euryarchaeota archaeon 55_53]KUK30831.1 MAG: hypothetical protein XD62_0090 [Methanosarcinales archeaon 56_1174]MDI3487372.1 hypothetical protein [Methanosarcinales archaeon]MDN5294554.1 hypothetical protein [Methanosarcinales archaeon]HIH69716.1 hypothetical protein [Methermicoccus shengliensis]
MTLQKLSLADCIRNLKEGINDFYVEVEVLNVERRMITSKGNIFVRALIKEGDTIATLVVWSSVKNTKNIEVIERNPARIRIIRPIKPSEWGTKDYNVDIWAHENITKIEEI